jgi:hypothetical protein
MGEEDGDDIEYSTESVTVGELADFGSNILPTKTYDDEFPPEEEDLIPMDALDEQVYWNVEDADWGAKVNCTAYSPRRTY